MPARWESSQRPLFVRTVWVDGSRHAILSPQDPLVQGLPVAPASRSDSRATSSEVSSSEVSSCDELAHCLIKLQLVLGHSGGARTRKSVKPERPKTTRPTKCREQSDYDADKEGRRASVASAAATMFARYKRPFVPEIFHSSSDEEPDVDEDEWVLRDTDALLPELSSNPLSERVLQWLDLAGKTAEEVSEPAPRQRPLRAPRRSVLSAAPRKAVDQQPLPSVNVRGLRTRRKRPSLADNHAASDEAWRREMARLASVRVATPPVEQEPLRATTCVDRGRTQLHIFMPPLPREAGVRPRHRGDADNVSESGTQWSEY